MTTTLDPSDSIYLDEADVRGELTRVFDVCQSCRRCLDRCSSFPTLFEMLDAHEDHEAGNLTPAQQDLVVDQCHQCKLCVTDCPYAPGRDEANVDVPRLMLRASAMQRDGRHSTKRSKAAARAVGRTDLVGKIATRVPSVANRLTGSPNGSLTRRLVTRLTGLTSQRTLPSYAERSFSRWFAARPRVTLGRRQATVTVFPTCLVEYHDPGVGSDLVRVYERNGIECSDASTTCCGAGSLHAGDLRRFRSVADANVRNLATSIRGGADVVVAQPSCGYAIRRDYPDHVSADLRDDAELVAAHTFDASEYLMRLHRSDETVLDTDFVDDVPETVTHHVPSTLRALGIEWTSRDLLKLTGARVRLVQQRAGVDSTWGLRADHDEVAAAASVPLGDRVERVGGDVVAGDCSLANLVIEERTGRRPVHPIQVIARAYGLPAE